MLYCTPTKNPLAIASLNIEHAYLERTGQYVPFEGIAFADTLDMAEARQLSLFTEENTERVERQKQAEITVIIGNPPYNVGQVNESENNKNRQYKVIDDRERGDHTGRTTAGVLCLPPGQPVSGRVGD